MKNQEDQNGAHEDVYAAKLMRHMVNIARRKAVFAAQQSVAFMVFDGGCGQQRVDNTGINLSLAALEGVQEPHIDSDKAMPSSLREFVRLLAEELETAEIDPDET